MKQAALTAAQNQAGATTRRSARHASSSGAPTSLTPQKRAAPSDSNAEEGAARKPNIPAQDFVGFFADLNVNMRIIATIAQEMISFYALCDRLKEDFNPAAISTQASSTSQASWNRNAQRTGGQSADDSSRQAAGFDVDSVFLVQLLNKMRTLKEADVAHPASGRPAAVNRLLERTQGAG